jgi:hypothetical protein
VGSGSPPRNAWAGSWRGSDADPTKRIDERHAAGELSDDSHKDLQKIIQKARAGDWGGAEKRAYEFREQRPYFNRPAPVELPRTEPRYSMYRSMNHGVPSVDVLIILDWMLRIEQVAAFVEGDRESDPETWGPEWDLFGWAPTIDRDDKGDDDDDSPLCGPGFRGPVRTADPTEKRLQPR